MLTFHRVPFLFKKKHKQASVGSRIFLSKATYESHRGVTCEVPRSHDTDVALSDYHVRVSNDGHLWSQPLPFLILDGLCLTCTARDMRCEIKVGKYRRPFCSICFQP